MNQDAKANGDGYEPFCLGCGQVFGSARAFHRAMHLLESRFCRDCYCDDPERLLEVGLRQLAIAGTLHVSRSASGYLKRVVGVSPNGELTTFREFTRVKQAEKALAELKRRHGGTTAWTPGNGLAGGSR